MKIYTKGGDTGETALFDGSRVSKRDARVDAYGDVDECNACLGVVLSHLTAQDAPLRTLLFEIQRRLFNVGAILADPARKSPKQDKEALQAADIGRLEQAIDEWETRLSPLRAFILPGGGAAGAMLHLARTVCRRAERKVVALHQMMPVPLEVIQYLNRLSDFLFVAARLVNHEMHIPEEQW